MKPSMLSILLSAALCCATQLVLSQTSTMEFQIGTTIEVTSGAEICADVVIISGSYSGTGTQCDGAPLPVELAAISAQASGTSATLRWATATEMDNFGFEIERRSVPDSQALNLEPETWNVVGFVRGSGTSSSPREYSFSDQGLASGRYAYRIKQMDYSGSFAYTNALEIEVGLAPLEFSLGQNYPNPFNPTTTIEFTLPEDGHVTLKIFDLAGREIATLVDKDLKAGVYHQAVFDASQLASGTYVSRLQASGRELVKKMMLVK